MFTCSSLRYTCEHLASPCVSFRSEIVSPIFWFITPSRKQCDCLSATLARTRLNKKCNAALHGMTKHFPPVFCFCLIWFLQLWAPVRGVMFVRLFLGLPALICLWMWYSDTHLVGSYSTSTQRKYIGRKKKKINRRKGSRDMFTLLSSAFKMQVPRRTSLIQTKGTLVWKHLFPWAF